MERFNNCSKGRSIMCRAVFLAIIASAAMTSHGVVIAQALMPGHSGMAATTAQPGAKTPMKMHAAMTDMQKKMSSMTMTGKADIDFAMMMVAHHQAAIDMAKAELETGKDPVMLKTARKIIAAQTKEIAQLEAWLKKNRHAM